jgi:hypothetical protein
LDRRISVSPDGLTARSRTNFMSAADGGARSERSIGKVRASLKYRLFAKIPRV